MSVVRNQTVCQLFGFPVFAAENEAHGMGEAACVSAPPTLGMSAAVADTELLPAMLLVGCWLLLPLRLLFLAEIEVF